MKGKITTFASALLTLIVLSGCATTPKETALSENDAQRVSSSTVYLLATEEGVTGSVVQSTAGSSLGLIGAVLDGMANSQKHDAMADATATLNKHVGTLDFRNDIKNALIQSRIFRDGTKITPITYDTDSYSQMRELAMNSPTQPVVTIRSKFMMDATYRVMVMNLDFHLWEDKGETHKRLATTTYLSLPIQGERKTDEEQAKTMIAKWATDNATRFHDAYKEGITELVEMTKLAFVDRPSSLPIPNDKPMRYVDYSLTPDPYFFNWKVRNAKLIRDSAARKIGLADDAHFVSIPAGPDASPEVNSNLRIN